MVIKLSYKENLVVFIKLTRLNKTFPKGQPLCRAVTVGECHLLVSPSDVIVNHSFFFLIIDKYQFCYPKVQNAFN